MDLKGGIKLSLQAGTHVTCTLGRGGKSIKQIIFAQTMSFWKKYRNSEMFWGSTFLQKCSDLFYV
jgi:hypothetical protein